MKPREDKLYKRTGIYGIRCKVNGKIYIGQTNMNFGDRQGSHFSLLNNNKHQNKGLQSDWNKYGKENFEFIILHDLKDGEDLDTLERSFISEYRAKDGIYNILEGGERGYKMGPLPESVKKKIGEKNRIHMTGKKLSQETRQKISEAHKKRIASLSEEEQKERIKNFVGNRKGKKMSEEQRQRLVEEQKTKPHGAKYNVEIVKEIRRLHEDENKSYKEISETMNISKQTVYLIATYRRWKNVS